MTEIDTLLRDAAERLPVVAVDDVTQDLARGRRELSRRTHRRVFVTVASGACAAAAAVVLAMSPAGTTTDRGDLAGSSGVVPAPPTQTAPPMTAVALVSYRGTQPAGFTVTSLPAGWFLQGVTETALTIAPAGTTDPDPASYLDKLVVMLQSSDGDQTVPTGPGAVSVAGRPGQVSTDLTGYRTLIFDDGAGHTVLVQAAPNLHWDVDDLVGFAAGVQVTADAVQTHG